MKVRIAYIEELPFYGNDENQNPKGSDIELTKVVLHAIGILDIEFHFTTFEQLLKGVQDGRWDMNVPIFVTDERAKEVAFSLPVWTLGDGFLLQKGNPKAIFSYEDIALKAEIKLGIIPGQIQFNSAKTAGVNDNQIVFFDNQPDAIDGLLTGKIDAFAATAVGNREVVKAKKQLDEVPLKNLNGTKSPMGAFSFNKNNEELINSVNKQLRVYLGSEDHRNRMAKYGIMNSEIDSIVGNKNIE